MNATDVINLKLPPEVMGLVQRGLAHAGFYSGTYGGVPGAKTLEALEAYFKGSSAKTSDRDRFVDALVALALSQVGVREKPKNSNSGPEVQEYQSADDLGGGGYAWCASFQCWLIREVLKKGFTVPFTRPTTALAWGFENWGKAQPGTKLYKSGQVKKGDLVMFTFSHIGIAIADEKDGYVLTVEGNTDATGGREGGGVYKQTRNRTLIRSFVRFEF